MDCIVIDEDDPTDLHMFTRLQPGFVVKQQLYFVPQLTAFFMLSLARPGPTIEYNNARDAFEVYKFVWTCE